MVWSSDAARFENNVRNALKYGTVDAITHPVGRVLRHAAVLLPLVRVGHDWHLLLTRRTDTVQDHKGQVSFPGGAVEADDENEEKTALRETMEEIGLSDDNVDIWGRLPDAVTISDYLITPVVGHVLCWPCPLLLEPGEVSRVFTIPLAWLLDPSHHREDDVVFGDQIARRVVYFDLYDGELLWGITARITLDFLQLITENPPRVVEEE